MSKPTDSRSIAFHKSGRYSLGLVISIALLLFIAENLFRSIEQGRSPGRWAPKRAEGPLLYDIAFTNPSKFSADNKSELLTLYYTQGKRVFVNSGEGQPQLALYYRIFCSLTLEGEISLNGYEYDCPNVVIDSELESYSSSSPCSEVKISKTEPFVKVCDPSHLRRSNAVAVVNDREAIKIVAVEK